MQTDVTIIVGAVAVGGFFLALQKIRFLIPGLKESEIFSDFVRSARKRGLSFEQIVAEHQFRVAMTRTRRIVSERVLASPGSFRAILREVATEESFRFDKKQRKKFLAIVMDETSHWLLPEAAKAVQDYERQQIDNLRAIHKPHPDYIDAMRTR